MLPNYSSTPNKERVRQEDSILIKKERDRKGRKLSYLGMPSGAMKDIIAWAENFDRCTAIEVDESQRRELAFNLMRRNLHRKVDILFGDIEVILLKGQDKHKNRLVYPYDVVFLDFFGTLLYKDQRRVKAINALLDSQRNESFLFLLTFNLRERKYCKHTVKSVLTNVRKEVLQNYSFDAAVKMRVSKAVEWYENADERFRQKLFVPYYVKTNAERSGFDIHCYAPIFYYGYNKSPMIHFAFKLTSGLDSSFKAVSKQSYADIINLNLKIASKGRISVANKQGPKIRIA